MPDTSPVPVPKSKAAIGNSRSGWWALAAVVFVVVVYLLSVYLVGTIVATFLTIYQSTFHHWSQAHITDWLTNAPIVQFIYIVVAEAFTVACLALGLKWFKLSWRTIGLRRLRWTDPLAGLAMFVPYIVTYLAVIALCQKLFPALNIDQEQQLGFSHVSGTGNLVITFISLVILPPLVEELLVRGFLYTSLRRSKLPKLAAMLTASVVFATGHLQIGSGAPLLWVAFIDTFVLSMFLIWLRDLSKGLYAGMVLHGLKNLLAFVSLFIIHTH